MRPTWAEAAVSGRSLGYVNAEEIQTTWLAYRTSGEPRMRDRLIVACAPEVEELARRLGPELPAQVDQGDLVSYGLLGLIAAIDTYRLELGVKLQPYALQRARWAILEELRALDWIPRLTREREWKLCRGDRRR